jgi:predicted nucleic acid-binding protein
VAVILDTNAVSALLAGEPALGDVLAAQERHQLPVVVIGEYRYGLLRSRHREPLERLLGELADECEVLEVGRVTAQHYAEVRDELRRRGRPIPENDVWIAALAREHAQPVVSRDEHFDHVVGIRRVGW